MAEIKASLSLKGWNDVQLKLRIPTILRSYGDVMDQQLKEEIKTVQYPWPRTTRRRNGTVVGSPRDIVDLGGLLRSQRRDYPSATQLVFSWNAKSKGFPYAGLVLTGYTTNKGTVVPGRNWIKPALDKHPLDAFFIREWRKLARSGL